MYHIYDLWTYIWQVHCQVSEISGGFHVKSLKFPGICRILPFPRAPWQVVMKEFCAAASQYSQAKADLRNIETRLAYGAHKAPEIFRRFREGQHLLCNDLENFRSHFPW
jgi:hypothetical protein